MFIYIGFEWLSDSTGVLCHVLQFPKGSAEVESMSKKGVDRDVGGYF